MDSKSEKIRNVNDAVAKCKGIAWDTCHKIYILMDDEEMETMRGYGYDPLLTHDGTNTEELQKLIWEWFELSCGLRFINAVKSVPLNPNEGFEQLIPQFDEDFLDDDEEDLL